MKSEEVVERFLNTMKDILETAQEALEAEDIIIAKEGIKLALDAIPMIKTNLQFAQVERIFDRS